MQKFCFQDLRLDDSRGPEHQGVSIVMRVGQLLTSNYVDMMLIDLTR
jgi:hypothetical protein